VPLVQKKEKETKQVVMGQLTATLNKAAIAVVMDYRGLSVADMSVLRKLLHPLQATFTVAKNTLARRVFKDAGQTDVAEALKGPTALLVGRSDQVAPLKAVLEFLKKAKKTDNKVRGGVLDGQFLTAVQVGELADLPPLIELRGKLLGGIASPLSGTVAALSSPQRSLVTVLSKFAELQQAKAA
jgi:large subunit ribosomal protein L10